MSIVVTPIPRLVDLAAPAFTLGTANAAGSADTAVASDSTLLAFDAVAVDAITFGQSGSVGTATVAPRRDHVHAMEAETPTVAASEAEMEAASSNTVFVTPGRTQNHPGVAKVWARINFDGSATDGAYNVASITDTATGSRSVNYTTAFSSGYDQCSVLTISTASADGICVFWTSQAVGALGFLIRDSISPYALQDNVCAVAVFGAQ
jgi:hypothetical protein